MALSHKDILVTRIKALTGHEGSVYTLYQGAGSDSILSAGGDGMVARWDLKLPGDGDLLARIPAHVFSLLQVSGSQIVVGQMQGGIHVLDIDDKTEQKHLALHEKGVFDLKLSPDGEHFFAAGGDGVLSVWDTATFELKHQVPVSGASLRSLAFSIDDKTLAIGSSDNRVYIMDARSLAMMEVLEGHENSVFCVQYSPDGKYLLSGSRDAHFHVWKPGKKYQLYRRIPAHRFTINSIAFSPCGRMFATAGRDKEIRIWDAQNFELLKVINHDKYGGHVNSVNQVLWVPFNNYLISASDDRSLMIWDIEVTTT